MKKIGTGSKYSQLNGFVKNRFCSFQYAMCTKYLIFSLRVLEIIIWSSRYLDLNVYHYIIVLKDYHFAFIKSNILYS